MRRTGNMQTSNFVAAATKREGCDWAVWVDLAARPRVATASPLADVPRGAVMSPRARRACESVARRVAAEMNAARKGL